MTSRKSLISGSAYRGVGIARSFDKPILSKALGQYFCTYSTEIETVLLSCFVGIVIIFDIRSSLVLCAAAFLTFSSLRIHKRQAPLLGMLDISILVFLASSGLSTWLALYRPAAVVQMGLRASAGLVYFAIRRWRGTLGALLVPLVGAFMVYCARALIYFARDYREWLLFGFTRLVDFRAYVTLTPHGVRPGNPNSVFLVFMFLCMLGFVELVSPKFSVKAALIIAIALSLICVVLSFSRGLYLATLAGLSLYYASPPRKKLVGSALMTIVWFCMLCMLYRTSPIAEAILDTLRFNTTGSQLLSLEGRSEYFLSGVTLLGKAPLTGVGLDNFALGMRVFSLHNDPSTVSQPFNVFVSVAAEQGLLGLLSFLFVCLAAFRSISRRAYLESRVVLGAACVSLAVYALCQAYLFSGPAITIPIFLLLGLLSREATNVG
jgi:hypothetical protein